MSNTTVGVNGPLILDSFTPLAFLPPDLAFQMSVSNYIQVGTLGLFFWDIINNIGDDYDLFSQHRTSLPTITYFVSKLSSLGFVLALTLFQTAPHASCLSSSRCVQVLFSIAIPSTSLLFFFRACAVFDRNPWAVALFGFLWLAVLAGCLTTVTGTSATTIGQTQYCITGSIKSYSAAGAIIPPINDTIVFLAITWRLWCNSYARRTFRDGVRVWAFGDYLPAFSKSMLQDGQAYYLTTVVSNVIFVIVLCIPPIPGIYRTAFAAPNIILMNIMACRVYRNTVFALFKEAEISLVISRDLGAASLAIPVSKQGTIATQSATHNLTHNNIDTTTVTGMAERTVEDCLVGDKDEFQMEICNIV